MSKTFHTLLKSALAVSLLFSFAACDGVFDGAYKPPVCLVENGTLPRYAEPTRKMNFVIRLIDQDQKPVANVPIMYSYATRNTDLGGNELIIFNESFVTDENGYVVFQHEGEKRIELRGTSWSSSEQ